MQRITDEIGPRYGYASQCIDALATPHAAIARRAPRAAGVLCQHRVADHEPEWPASCLQPAGSRSESVCDDKPFVVVAAPGLEHKDCDVERLVDCFDPHFSPSSPPCHLSRLSGGVLRRYHHLSAISPTADSRAAIFRPDLTADSQLLQPRFRDDRLPISLRGDR